MYAIPPVIFVTLSALQPREATWPLFENAGISRRRLEADVTPPHVNRPPSSDQYASSLGTLYYLFVFTLRELRNGDKGFLEKLNVSLRTVFLEDQFLETFREWDGMGLIFISYVSSDCVRGC